MMTIRRILECDLSEGDVWGCFIKGWCALDTTTGAFLSASHGRTKYGDTKYVLILPTQTPDERGGLLASYDWNQEDRKFIRAYSLEEALEVANKRLEKMIAKRAAIAKATSEQVQQ